MWTGDFSDRISGSRAGRKYSNNGPRRKKRKQQLIGGSFRLYIRAFGSLLRARNCRVRLLNAEYSDNAVDQPCVRIVVKTDQYDVACRRICWRDGDHGGDHGRTLIMDHRSST